MAHAVNVYGSKDYYKSASREADLFLHTQRSAKQLMDSLEASCSQQWEILKTNRNKLQVRPPLRDCNINERWFTFPYTWDYCDFSTRLAPERTIPGNRVSLLGGRL